MSRFMTLTRLSIALSFILILGLCLFGPNAVLAEEAGHGEPAAHGETSAAGHGEDSHGGLSSEKIWNLFWRVMNFAVLFLVIFFLLRKPLAKFLTNRRETIAQTLAEFEDKKIEAKARFKELESKLADLESEREEILRQYAQIGEEEKEKIIANAQEMAERIKQQAEITIRQEINRAKADLVREIADMSASMAEDLIKKNINDQDQQRLVEDYLEKVVQN